MIEISHLSVAYQQQGVWRTVVEDLSLSLAPGEAFGLVGESGSGKSTTANALLGYQPPSARYLGGSVRFHGQDLLRMGRRELQRLRGKRISLVPQNPATALSPAMRVGRQIEETLLAHRFCAPGPAVRRRTVELLEQVSLPAPSATYAKYPHQLSGGQQQRVVIAMALACNPELVVLDEPTTGLDVTTQAQILGLLTQLRQQYGLALLYVTHNLSVVAQLCDRIGVMYAGRMLEVAPREDLFCRPKHPYTQGLIAAIPGLNAQARQPTVLLQGLLERHRLPAGCCFAPRCEFAVERCWREPQVLAPMGDSHAAACWRWHDLPPYAERIARSLEAASAPPAAAEPGRGRPVLTVSDLRASYEPATPALLRQPAGRVVLDGISFTIPAGETFALVGESGSGKSTTAKALNGFLPRVSGEMLFDDGTRTGNLTTPVERRPPELLRAIQLIFQNPDASLNPRQRVADILGLPLRKFFGLSGRERRQRSEALLQAVRLEPSYLDRFPDELSGGERQRIAIARALAGEPTLLLCDEVVSALDVSVQASILKLLAEIQAQRRLACLFISHDLAVVRSLAHQVGVLYLGFLCEVGRVEEVFGPPFHPYTHFLLSAVPEYDPEHALPAPRPDSGRRPEPPHTGCPFAPRCPWKVGPICDDVVPPWQPVSDTHGLRCHLPLDQLRRLATAGEALPAGTAAAEVS